MREAKAQEKAQFRALHEGKYLPLKKRCAAFERCTSHQPNRVQDAKRDTSYADCNGSKADKVDAHTGERGPAVPGEPFVRSALMA